jgi:hypothetical protein
MKGIKVQVSGRLNGRDCTSEWKRDGRVPLHTLRAKLIIRINVLIRFMVLLELKCGYSLVNKIIGKKSQSGGKKC